MMLPQHCNSLWIGALGPIERPCLRSAVRHGHPVTLYSYRELGGVPEGVELKDAAEILPESAIIRHRSGSVALFANWFRYELQRRSLGIWLDTDQYLLAPIPAAKDHLFGWQQPGFVGTAVLHLPASSLILPELMALFDRPSVPPWLPWRSRIAAELRRAATGQVSLAALPWGSAGPNAVTALARKHGLLDQAVSRETFYPVHYRDAGWLRDPRIALEAMIAPDSIGIHLWNEKIKGWKDEPAPPGSFLARLQAEGAPG